MFMRLPVGCGVVAAATECDPDRCHTTCNEPASRPPPLHCGPSLAVCASLEAGAHSVGPGFLEGPTGKVVWPQNLEPREPWPPALGLHAPSDGPGAPANP